MKQKKIDRINYLAKKSKTEALTPAELEEQKLLRGEYLAAVRRNLEDQLDNTYIVDENGNKHKLKERG